MATPHRPGASRLGADRLWDTTTRKGNANSRPRTWDQKTKNSRIPEDGDGILEFLTYNSRISNPIAVCQMRVRIPQL